MSISSVNLNCDSPLGNQLLDMSGSPISPSSPSLCKMSLLQKHVENYSFPHLQTQYQEIHILFSLIVFFKRILIDSYWARQHLSLGTLAQDGSSPLPHTKQDTESSSTLRCYYKWEGCPCCDPDSSFSYYFQNEYYGITCFTFSLFCSLAQRQHIRSSPWKKSTGQHFKQQQGLQRQLSCYSNTLLLQPGCQGSWWHCRTGLRS